MYSGPEKLKTFELLIGKKNVVSTNIELVQMLRDFVFILYLIVILKHIEKF